MGLCKVGTGLSASMGRRQRHTLDAGPPRSPRDRGSQKRLSRIRLRGNWSIEVILAAIAFLLMLIFLFPRVLEQAIRHH